MTISEISDEIGLDVYYLPEGKIRDPTSIQVLTFCSVIPIIDNNFRSRLRILN